MQLVQKAIIQSDPKFYLIYGWNDRNVTNFGTFVKLDMECKILFMVQGSKNNQKTVIFEMRKIVILELNIVFFTKLWSKNPRF